MGIISLGDKVEHHVVSKASLPNLSLLGSQPLLGCCYLKAELMLLTLTFKSVLSLLGNQPLLGCCYLKAELMLLTLTFKSVLSLLGSQPLVGCCYLEGKRHLYLISAQLTFLSLLKRLFTVQQI